MFLLDDILLAPIKGLAAICQKVHDAALEDLEQQEKDILATLTELHQLMDAGRNSRFASANSSTAWKHARK
jgi:hypothetical protein